MRWTFAAILSVLVMAAACYAQSSDPLQQAIDALEAARTQRAALVSQVADAKAQASALEGKLADAQAREAVLLAAVEELRRTVEELQATTRPSKEPSLTPPAELKSSVHQDGTIQVQWVDRASGESGYKIDRSSDGGVTWEELARIESPDLSSYSDTTAQRGLAYTYRVRAFLAGAANGDYSPASPAAAIPDRAEAELPGGTAPFVVFVDAAPLVGRFDFGDAGARWNELEGFNAAKLLDRPGRYIVRTIVNGRTETGVVNVAEDVRPRFYVSAEGNDDNPGTKSHPLRTWAAAIARTHTGNVAVFFRRGDVFDHDGSRRDVGSQNVLLAAYGDENKADPVIRYDGPPRQCAALNMTPGSARWVFRDLTFSSTVKLAYGNPQANINNGNGGGLGAIAFGGREHALVDVTIDNLDVPFGGQVDRLLMQNVRSTDRYPWRSFGVPKGTEHVLLGCAAPRVASGGQLLRIAPDRVLVHDCDFANPGNGLVRFDSGRYGYVWGNRFGEGVHVAGPLTNYTATDATRANPPTSGPHVWAGNKGMQMFVARAGAVDVKLLDNEFVLNGAPGVQVYGWDPDKHHLTRNIAIQGNRFAGDEGRPAVQLSQPAPTDPAVVTAIGNTATGLGLHGESSMLVEHQGNSWQEGR